MLGAGDSDLRLANHLELSGSIMGWRLGDDVGRSRRVIAWMVGFVERDVRVERIWEPYDNV